MARREENSNHGTLHYKGRVPPLQEAQMNLTTTGCGTWEYLAGTTFLGIPAWRAGSGSADAPTRELVLVHYIYDTLVTLLHGNREWARSMRSLVLVTTKGRLFEWFA